MERERNYSCKFKWSYEEIDKRELQYDIILIWK